MFRSIFFIAITLLVYSCREHGCNVCKEWFYENDISNKYHGVIIEKFIDSNKRASPWFKLNNYKDYRIYNMDVFELAVIGDTVYKNEGSLKNHLIRNGDTIIFYQQCCHKDITDAGYKKYRD